MSITWTDPAVLWLLAAVPAVWIALLFGRTNFNKRQQMLQAGVRSLLIASLALAIARPVTSTGSSQQSIVYAVDVSHSVSGRAIEDAARRIDDLNAAVHPAHSRIVAFGGTSKVVPDTAALRALAPIEDGAARDVDRQSTDLEAGLAAARAELAPGHVPRIVLFTDGRETAGDVEEAVSRMAAEHIPVSVDPMGARAVGGDAWIDGIDTPGAISAGAAFTANVRIGSQQAGVAKVDIRSGGRTLESRDVLVDKGFTVVPFDVSLDQTGAQVLQAAVSLPGDPLAPNNALDRAVSVTPAPKVLYAEGSTGSAHYLARALTESGFDVTTRPGGGGLPSSAAGLDPYDVVILSDLSRAAIGDPQMNALADWVERGGGGLLVAGGEAVFGENGYRKTVLERLTPVTFERRDEPEVALIIVLDRSWSMAGTSMELCKAAAQAAVDVMTDEQSVGILTFNDRFDWDVTLRNVGRNRDAIRKKIAAIEPGGHTLIYPAVEQAYDALKTAKARAKHVILLSDGRSYPDDYEGLVKKMTTAHITVSSVAVGPAADAELLTNIAKWGKGRSYVVQDPKEVPQIFVKEAKNAATPSFDEKTIKAVVKTPAFLEGADLSHLPSLRGRTATVIKDTALELITTDDGDPLLAFWPIGIGRTAVFASDVKDRWAADWVKWRGYGPFFTSIVRALQRQRAPAAALEVTPGPIHGATRTLAIAVEARNPDGTYQNLQRPIVHVAAPNGTRTDVTTRQVAPGRYEARVIADARQLLTVSVPGGPSSWLVVPDPAAEYRFSAADESLLKSIASATGGTFRPTPESLANAPGDFRTARRPLWTSLLAIALGLWLVDVLLRRVRVLEPQ